MLPKHHNTLPKQKMYNRTPWPNHVITPDTTTLVTQSTDLITAAPPGLPTCLSVLSACLPACLPVCLSACLPVCLVCLPALSCLSACLSVLSACLSCLSACLCRWRRTNPGGVRDAEQAHPPQPQQLPPHRSVVQFTYSSPTVHDLLDDDLDHLRSRSLHFPSAIAASWACRPFGWYVAHLGVDGDLGTWCRYITIKRYMI